MRTREAAQIMGVPRTKRQMLERMRWMAERMLERADRSAATLAPDYLLNLARTFHYHGYSLLALDLSRRALRGVRGNPIAETTARRFLRELVPGYHLPMMNDARRNAAWDQALRRSIRPGMHVLEIGTGAGMLALMAARAGAERVITCEFHPLVAEVARQIIAENGFSDRVTVLTKPSQQLLVGVDLERRADLLFCDNFSDNFFSFEPTRSIADARARLLVRGAPSLPKAAAVRLALAHWENAPRFFQSERICDFDVRAADVFVPDAMDMELGDASLRLLSEAREAFRFDFSSGFYPPSEQAQVPLEAAEDGVVNGISQWIRLELDGQTALEARPEPGAVFFSNPRFYPLPQPLHLRKGEVVRVHAGHDSRSLWVWVSGSRTAPSPVG